MVLSDVAGHVKSLAMKIRTLISRARERRTRDAISACWHPAVFSEVRVRCMPSFLFTTCLHTITISCPTARAYCFVCSRAADAAQSMPVRVRGGSSARDRSGVPQLRRSRVGGGRGTARDGNGVFSRLEVNK